MSGLPTELISETQEFCENLGDRIALEEVKLNLSVEHISEQDIEEILKFGFLEKHIFKVHDPFLYRRAFVHKSIPVEVKKRQELGIQCCEYMEDSYETLEYTGDSLFSAAVSVYLHETYSGVPEGELSEMRKRIVEGKNMTILGDKMGLRKHILVSGAVVNKNSNDSFV